MSWARLSRAAALALWLWAPAAPQPSAEARSWNEPVEAFPIADSVYYVGAREVCSYLIRTPAGAVLVDGGFAETAPQILANLERLGVSPREVKWIVNSHAHVDHCGGLARLKQETKASLAAMAEDVPLLESGGAQDPHGDGRASYEPVRVDRALRDGERLLLGGVAFTAHRTAGHSPGCTTWTFRSPLQGRERDFVIVGSPTVQPGYQLVSNPRYPQVARDYEQQFEVLESLPCDVFLASHGSFYGLTRKRTRLGEAESPFLDEDGYRDFVERWRRRFEDELEKQVKAQDPRERGSSGPR